MYEKQTWVTGDVVTADRLNHMEDGISSGGGSDFDLLITLSTDNEPPTISADGLSVSQLVQKIPNGLKVGLIDSRGFRPAYMCDVDYGANNDRFETWFVADAILSAQICVSFSVTGNYFEITAFSDGEIMPQYTGQYNYSDGHYTISNET